MVNKKVTAVLIALTIVISILFTSSSRTVFARQNIPLDKTLVYSGGETSNLREYDPATTHGSGDKLVYSGLVSFDPHLNITPDLAKTWEVNKDGTVYTFHIRANAKFHDGRTVTAQDVVYSWERAANPQIGSDTVGTYLGDIVGVKEMLAGQTDHISGLKVIDDLTLQVAIDAPKPYFIMKLTYPTAFVVDKKNVESGKEWVHSPNGTGPYRLTEWLANDHILYEANQDFYLGPPSVLYVLIKINAGVDTRLYETNVIDIAGVGMYDADRFLDPAEPLHNELLMGVSLCTGYVVFDTTQPPFDDVNVRKAFSMAFDRQRYIDVVLRGQALPAIGLYPPGLPGFNYGLKGLPYDPAQARELLKQSKYGGPQGLPPIVYTDAGIGTSLGPEVAAMAEMWEQNLGVKITVENLEFDYYYDQVQSGNHGQMISGGWCADYPDPENFADVLFHSGSKVNGGGYSNPKLDTLLEQARVERNVSTRIGLYQQAEQIIVNDAPVLFTTHSLSYQLVKPYVKGYVFTPIAVPIERYLWLEGK
jgi:oligopeptide transport system substrate-binding protein